MWKIDTNQNTRTTICVCIYIFIYIHVYMPTHIKEYHSILKRKEILMHATTQTNLEVISLCKISQSQKTNTV
jgi:hypothetical protein